MTTTEYLLHVFDLWWTFFSYLKKTPCRLYSDSDPVGLHSDMISKWAKTKKLSILVIHLFFICVQICL